MHGLRTLVIPVSLMGHVAAAKKRLAELEARPTPTARAFPARLERHATLAVWMKPDFEGILAHESAVRFALGLRGQSIAGWPRAWTEVGPRRMDAVLDQAIEAARRHRPRPPIFRSCGLPFRSAKHTWASLLIAHGGDQMAQHMRSHSLGARLREILPRP